MIVNRKHDRIEVMAHLPRSTSDESVTSCSKKQTFVIIITYMTIYIIIYYILLYLVRKYIICHWQSNNLLIIFEINKLLFIVVVLPTFCC